MIAVLLNPQSGAVKHADELLRKIEAALPDAQIFTGAGAGETEAAARRAVAEGCETIIAAGGDGTLNEVLNGLMPDASAVRLGLLPLGTGNDFARALLLPTELDAALQVISAGHTRLIDVVRVTSSVGTHYFLNVSAGGFSGAVSEKMTGDLKAAWGSLAYVRGMIEALPELIPHDCELTLDGEPPLPLRIFNLVIANAPYVAGGIPIAPDADIADGWLDVVAIRETSGPRLALLAPTVLAARHLGSEDVFFQRARRIEVRATPPMAFNTDGELLGSSPLVFEILPRAIRMIAPAA